MSKNRNTEYRPDYAVPPGESLREKLETAGMTQAELAERTGTTPKHVNEVLAGKAAISPDFALKLENVLGTPAAFWNARERDFRGTLARLSLRRSLAGDAKWLGKFPVGQMTKLGWMEKREDKVDQLQALLAFFGVAGVKQWKEHWFSPQAAFRTSPAFRNNPHCVAAWLRRGELKAQNVQASPFDTGRFRSALAGIRNMTTLGAERFVPELVRLCAESGVAAVFVPRLPGMHAYGATRWLSPTKALIQLSLRGRTDDLFWFAFFHEAGHILRHGKREEFLEYTGEPAPASRQEREADSFACDILIPPASYRRFVAAGRFDPASIGGFARAVSVAPGIVVGRLQHEGRLPYNSAYNRLKRHFAFRPAQN